MAFAATTTSPVESTARNRSEGAGPSLASHVTGPQRGVPDTLPNFVMRLARRGVAPPKVKAPTTGLPAGSNASAVEEMNPPSGSTSVTGPHAVEPSEPRSFITAAEPARKMSPDASIPMACGLDAAATGTGPHAIAPVEPRY